MNTFEYLDYKKKYRPSYKKSDEYRYFIENKVILNKIPRFSYLGDLNENEFDVIRANIIIQSFLNKSIIEKEIVNLSLYQADINATKLKLMNSLRELMVDQPYYQENKNKIYIPFFSRALNALYSREPVKLLDAPYSDLKNTFVDSVIDPFDTYGAELYNSTFTRLLKIGTNGKEIAFFHYDFNTLYFVNNQGRLDNKIVLFDKYMKRPNYNHMIERIKPVVEAYFANDCNEMLNALHDNGLISSRMLYQIHRRKETK